MKRMVLMKYLMAGVIAATSISNAAACTLLLYTDAKGRAYTGRTVEFVGETPNRLTYYPMGTRFESVMPDGKQ
ncbi:MAG: hypothetical protein EoVTN8_948 [Fluviibacter phosphoraccumulans EoVTN8]